MDTSTQDLIPARTDVMLRRLDPAPPVDDVPLRRAEAARHRILASDPAAPLAVEPPDRRRPAVRWVAIPAAAAALAAVGWALPGQLGGAHPAYASWSASPGTLAAADRAVADAACRDQLRMPSPEPVVAERRGAWVALLYTGGDLVGACLAHVPPGAGDAGYVTSGAASGSDVAYDDGVDGHVEGAFFQFGGPTEAGQEVPTVSFTEGRVGPEVDGLTLETPGGTEVEATITDGRYVAWWPGPAFPEVFDDEGGEGGPTPGVTYLLRSDGEQTRIEVTAPATP
ncbi:hypothetical protein GXB85_05195 [Cellulomonas sp. APG4]|uniref:hypothetical protein n=1 Tax=Cellulomonas sp. APG4 TaxID=1538656 RepID=UPI0013799431|nr:hypothetical protein [Cellulomonas sp. APG4]NCT90349.1 hypothetical protein [Cellulomonas sp. APG4]